MDPRRGQIWPWRPFGLSVGLRQVKNLALADGQWEIYSTHHK